jgi:hypothetical protein
LKKKIEKILGKKMEKVALEIDVFGVFVFCFLKKEKKKNVWSKKKKEDTEQKKKRNAYR